MAGNRHEHHHRKARNTGGTNMAQEDLDHKNQRYTYQSKVNDEAEERKRGGRTEHHKDCKCHKCMGGKAERKHGGMAKKHVGEVHGEHEKARADRKPRKNGGRTGADQSPFSSARHGSVPKGRNLEGVD